MTIKVKTIYVCSHCDAQFPKWLGKCPECNQWGTISATVKTVQRPHAQAAAGKVIGFHQIAGDRIKKIATGLGEFDRVVGGGLSAGSMTLLSGEPGIGKSTLVLQVADRIAATTGKPVLYVSGEESAGQIKDRIVRLQLKPEHFSYLEATDVQTIAATIAAHVPPLTVVDSVQTIRSAEVTSESGSLSQIKACTAALVDTAKATGAAVMLIGHITKTGTVAGPKALEHLVDTVLSLEGDNVQAYRLLRTVKNRFGATSELGVFEMHGAGLREVANPSAMFLAGRTARQPGAVVTPVIIGARVFLAEVQSLVSWTRYGYPQRNAIGYDFKRIALIATVLDQRVGIRLAKNDIHVKVAGGLKITDPGADLAVALAIISAQRKRTIDPQTAACGEVGLSGEIRPIPKLEQRVAEAIKLGFTTVIVPRMETSLPPQCLPVATIQDTLRELWGG
ncbi:MAG: DNA repair protein RadA [Patescibacteria group bacterium]|nr:DNA repair protein RadA [Patescibacteria group bacterium]